MAKPPALRLLRERKLADLLDPPRAGAVFEASGVIAVRARGFVVLDNVRRVARIGTHLRLQSDDHGWVGVNRQGEGYEAITYGRARRFYLMIEAQKHPDGTFKGAIEEYDDRWRFRGRRWVDFPFEKRNTGFEGLASVEWRGQHYLLALCEGNGCRDSRSKKKRGQGRIHVLERRGRIWRPVARIKLPKHAKFKDYAGMALHGDRLAVVSQESSRLWVGRLRRGKWTINGRGRVYDFPRTKKGKKRYYTVEGISWLSPRTLVAVSDLRKKRHAKRSAKTDQSIHVFRIPK
ncbi:MAG: hypothetical protein WD873_09020 [Candidatus Hydrogenedentales bacterium]